MLAWLPLAATLAFGQPARAPVAPAKQLADLRGAMERFVVVARPDAGDPAVASLGQELTQMHQKALQLAPDDADKVYSLKMEFDDWHNRWDKLAFNRRPEGAPNDPRVFRRRYDSAVGKQLSGLRSLVDPQSFRWYVEGSKDRSAIPGWGSAADARRPAAAASAGLPAGWTQASPGMASDLQIAAPPDPSVVSGVASIGERAWKYGGTVGKCYHGVKSILEKLGVVSSFTGERGRDGEGRLVSGKEELSGAYQFNRWVENHPTLQKRQLLRVPEPAWPLAVSDVVVWAPGACGYNDSVGHIEMIYKLSADQRQAWAVSDHSQEFNVACFERMAAKAVDARRSLPALQQAVADASQKAGAARARRALAAAQQAADSVSVYKIGPERP